jgi:hypothetical protein
VASALDAIAQSVLALVKPGGTGCQATLDGSTGRVIFGKAKLVEPDPASGELATFMKRANFESSVYRRMPGSQSVTLYFADEPLSALSFKFSLFF